MLRKDQDGSRRHKKVQEGSRRLKKAQEGLRRLKKVQECQWKKDPKRLKICNLTLGYDFYNSAIVFTKTVV